MMQEFSDRSPKDSRANWRERIIIAGAIGFGAAQMIWFFVGLFL